MKDKLEVGMYVKTIGGIERLKKENDNGWFFEKSMIIKPDNIEKYIIKASHNIIDLIEVGDYVNGEKVGYIDDCDGAMREYYYDYENPSVDVGHWFEEIKSIVTKEQFESMSYEVK